MAKLGMPGPRQWLWFVGLWAAGVGVTALVGYAMYFGGLVRRRRAVWLLRHGEQQPVQVTAVEATRLTINGAKAFRIEYQPVAGDRPARVERHVQAGAARHDGLGVGVRVWAPLAGR